MEEFKLHSSGYEVSNMGSIRRYTVGNDYRKGGVVGNFCTETE